MMAIATNWDIDYCCGHSATRDLSDQPAGQRAGRAAWLATQPCFDCYRQTAGRKVSAEVEAERSAERAAAEDFAKQNELPVLQGSEKQIAWAHRVRHELLRGAYDSLVEGGDFSEEQFDHQVLVTARNVDLAKWWIDNRDVPAAQLPELLADTGLSTAGATTENPY